MTPPAPVLAEARFDTGAVFAAGPRTAVGTEVLGPPRRGRRGVHLPHRAIIHASRACGRHSMISQALFFSDPSPAQVGQGPYSVWKRFVWPRYGAKMLARMVWAAVVFLLLFATPTAAFSVCPPMHRLPCARQYATLLLHSRQSCLLMRADEGEKQGSQDVTPMLRAVWSATEVIGNAAAALSGSGKDKKRGDAGSLPVRAKLTEEEALQSLRDEYEREYFLSGEIDMSLFEEDCLFSDPFAGFRGKERFKNNLENLSLFISRSQAKLLKLEVTQRDPLIITSRVMVKLQLNLPWKPVLAWPWSVEYVFSDRGLIAEHNEGWEVSAREGVAQVFRMPPKSGWPN